MSLRVGICLKNFVEIGLDFIIIYFVFLALTLNFGLNALKPAVEQQYHREQFVLGEELLRHLQF